MPEDKTHSIAQLSAGHVLRCVFMFQISAQLLDSISGSINQSPACWRLRSSRGMFKPNPRLYPNLQASNTAFKTRSFKRSTESGLGVDLLRKFSHSESSTKLSNKPALKYLGSAEIASAHWIHFGTRSLRWCLHYTFEIRSADDKHSHTSFSINWGAHLASLSNICMSGTWVFDLEWFRSQRLTLEGFPAHLDFPMDHGESLGQTASTLLVEPPLWKIWVHQLGVLLLNGST